MTIGFDMSDPIVDPDGNINQRTIDWNSFFLQWNQNPVFAGRYFGDTRHIWKNGEVPSNLRILVPNHFNSLRYILPFAPTDEFNENKRVDMDGNFVEEGGQPFFWKQTGKTEIGGRVNTGVIRKWGRVAAMKTCYEIITRLDEWGPLSRPRPTKGEFKLPSTGKIFLYLDVEPQTQLHRLYWHSWAEIVSTYSAYLGPIDNKTLQQPFLPCLYCSIWPNGPRSPVIRNFFRNTNVPRCHAIMSSVWSEVYETAEPQLLTEEEVHNLMPVFGEIVHSRRTGYPNAQVAVWQYFINHYYNNRFSIDFSITADIEYAGRPITDYMLEINW